MIDAYLDGLATSLHVRGRTRRRLLAECREHLIDLAGETSERDAVEAFGEPAAIAAAFDLEVAARRGTLGGLWASVGVLAVGGSTLAVIHGADPAANAPTAWAVVFALTAQVAMVATALALVQVLSIRREVSTAGDVALLCRRMALALVSAAAAMFSAGAALPGHGSATLLLAGPVLACVAAIAVLRAWRLVRRLEGAGERTDRSPFADLRRLTGVAIPVVGPVAVATLAAIAAVARDLGEAGSSLGGSLAVGGIEASLVFLAYVALRRPLGLRQLKTPRGCRALHSVGD